MAGDDVDATRMNKATVPSVTPHPRIFLISTLLICCLLLLLYRRLWLTRSTRLGVDADMNQYGNFCSAALEACRTIGEDQQVKAAQEGADNRWRHQ